MLLVRRKTFVRMSTVFFKQELNNNNVSATLIQGLIMSPRVTAQNCPFEVVASTHLGIQFSCGIDVIKNSEDRL